MKRYFLAVSLLLVCTHAAPTRNAKHAEVLESVENVSISLQSHLKTLKVDEFLDEKSTKEQEVTTRFPFPSEVENYDVNDVDYNAMRAQILAAEEKQMIGGDLEMKSDERIANTILMGAKWKEVDEGFLNPAKFLPAESFLKTKKDIEKSEVFKIIRRLPKGAVLHSHDIAIVSTDYVFYNITFRKNLYVCEDNISLRLKFFDKPDDTCDWELLSDVRNDTKRVKDVNKRIRKQMTMVTEHPEKAYPNVDAAWSKFMSIFKFLKPLLTYRPVYEDHFYRGLREFYDDNILYLELRSTLPELYELNGTVYGSLETVETYRSVMERFKNDHPDFVGAKLIYAPIRCVPKTTVAKYLITAKQLIERYPDFIAGFDLVGQEDKGEPLISFANELRNNYPKVNFFFHAGETNWNGLSTDQNLIDALLLNTKRIGHGFALTKHPIVMNELRKRGIAVEINPISNQVLGLVKDLRNHPGSVLFASEFPVVVSNDDPGLWGGRALSYDFYEAFVGLMSRSADLRALKQLAMNSITYSSLNDEEKEKAFRVWSDKWQQFVEGLIELQSATRV